MIQGLFAARPWLSSGIRGELDGAGARSVNQIGDKPATVPARIAAGRDWVVGSANWITRQGRPS